VQQARHLLPVSGLTPAPSGQHRTAEERAVLARLSLLDRFLPLWILLAMAGGLLLGRFFPAIQGVLDAVRIGNTSLPIALAWLLLPMQPEFRTGLILIGLAPCIAMVLIWIDLARGDREAAALLVAINSIIQVLAYALLGGFYLKVLPGWLGLASQDVAFSMVEIARAVLVFLGLPLAAGFLTRRIGLRLKGPRWYEKHFIPFISPFALYGLLFTIVVMFALQGQAITSDPLTVARVAVPLLLYFAIMWTVAFLVGRRSGLSYAKTATLAFTAAGNNFELAIAVSISVWGVSSRQALAGVIGPLIEVPVLVALVYLSLWFRRRFRFMTNPTSTTSP
jgi:ACR3 family arsenite transporter